MSSNKKKGAHKYKVKFTDTISLPKIKRTGRYFQDFCKKFKFNGVTLSVQNLCLLITAENEEALANVRTIIEVEIKRFIESSRPVLKMLPQNKISPLTKEQRKHKKLIPHDITRTSRARDCQHSKPVNQILRTKRRHWKNIKMIWKQWYINQRKFNVKFKAINQYFGQCIKQRHRKVSFFRHEKRLPSEYHQKKVLGRKRDRLKVKRAHRAKRRNKPRKAKKNKWKRTILRNTSKYNPRSNERERIVSRISKLKFITADSAKKMMFQLKTKRKSYLTMISGGLLEEEYDFPLFPWVNKISVDRKKFVIRYYNQQIFIYTASIGKNRPFKRNLVHTFSTLNENEIKSTWYSDTRFSPNSQPSPIRQLNINSSLKKKPKAVQKALPQISFVPMSVDDHISGRVKGKSKK